MDSDTEIVKSLLEHLNAEYKSGAISESTYKELRSTYEKKLSKKDEPLYISQDVKDLKAKLRNEHDSKEPRNVEELGLIKRLFKKSEKKKELPVEVAEPQEEITQMPDAENAANTQTVIPNETASSFVAEPAPEPIQETAAQTQETTTQAEPEAEMKPAESHTDAKTAEAIKPEHESILRKLFGKKEENAQEEKKEESDEKKEQPAAETQAQEPAPEVVQAEAEPVKDNSAMEIEKIKIIIDSIRDGKKATDETMQSMFESIGEIRTLSFQTDASFKELSTKLEKIDEEMTEISPSNFTKKINDINSVLEKHNMFLEKLDAKAVDLSEKVNQSYNLLRTIGGLENLVDLNKDLQQKISDIREVTKYIERISVKAEKTYMDLNERLNEFVIYKSKLDTTEEAVKDMTRAIDRINLNFENYISKKEYELLKSDLALLQTQQLELNKALPIIQMKIPETIMRLKKERDDISLFMTTLAEQAESGKISTREYNTIKEKNERKMEEIEEFLKKEWENFSKTVPGGAEGAQEAKPVPEEKTAQKKDSVEEKHIDKEKKEITEEEKPVEAKLPEPQEKKEEPHEKAVEKEKAADNKAEAKHAEKKEPKPKKVRASRRKEAAEIIDKEKKDEKPVTVEVKSKDVEKEEEHPEKREPEKITKEDIVKPERKARRAAKPPAESHKEKGEVSPALERVIEEQARKEGKHQEEKQPDTAETEPKITEAKSATEQANEIKKAKIADEKKDTREEDILAKKIESLLQKSRMLENIEIDKKEEHVQEKPAPEKETTQKPRRKRTVKTAKEKVEEPEEDHEEKKARRRKKEIDEEELQEDNSDEAPDEGHTEVSAM